MGGQKIHPGPNDGEDKKDPEGVELATIPRSVVPVTGPLEGIAMIEKLRVKQMFADKHAIVGFVEWLKKGNNLGFLNTEDPQAKKPGRTYLHCMVENNQYKVFKACMMAATKAKDGEPRIILDLVKPDQDGDTPLAAAVESQNSRIVHMMMRELRENKIWLREKDLIDLANTFPNFIAPYFDELRFSPPGGDEANVCQKTKRFPMPDKDFIVCGSNTESSNVEGLWDPLRADIDRAEKQGMMAGMMDCFKQLSMYPNMSGDVKAVSSACIGVENIAGPIKNAENDVLAALYKCGVDDIMGTDVMRAVLDFKWSTYAGRDYRKSFLTYIVYNLFFMLAMAKFFQGPVYNFATGELSKTAKKTFEGPIDEREFVGQELVPDVWAVVYHGILLLMSVYYIVKELMQIMKFGIANYVKDPYNFSELSCFVFVLLALVLHFMDVESAKIFASFAALQVWSNTFLRMRCFAGTGPFIRMVIEIINDMKYFMLITFMVIIAFAQAYYILINKTIAGGSDHPPGEYDMDNQFQSFSDSIFVVFIMLLGEFADTLEFWENGTSTPMPEVTKLFFVLFSLIGIIILLNLLIAIMGETYCRVLEDGVEDDWRMQQAGVICSMEADMSDKEKESPVFFPRWVHTLQVSDSQDEDEAELLVEKLHEMVDDVKQLVHFQLKDQKKMQKEFQAKIKTLMQETAKMQDTKDQLDQGNDKLASVKRMSERHERASTPQGKVR